MRNVNHKSIAALTKFSLINRSTTWCLQQQRVWPPHTTSSSALFKLTNQRREPCHTPKAARVCDDIPSVGSGKTFAALRSYFGRVGEENMCSIKREYTSHNCAWDREDGEAGIRGSIKNGPKGAS